MIKIENESEIAVLRMEHGKVNAIDLEFCKALIAALQQLESSPSKAAVLVGNERVFSAGVDLVALLNGGDEYLHEFLPALVMCFKTIFRFPKPLVAAINGHAVAGGCILATGCDRRLIHSKAKIGVPELRVGVPLPAIAIEIVRFAAAHEALQTMFNVGKTYRGDDAIRVGLADAIVEKDELLSLAIMEAKSLTAIPADVFAVTKQQLRAPANRIVEQNEKAFEAEVFKIWSSESIQSVIREFVEGRL